MEAPKNTPPSLGRLNIRGKASVSRGVPNASRGLPSQPVSKSIRSEASKAQGQKSFLSNESGEETASEDDDDDDLDVIPKAPNLDLFSKAQTSKPETKPGSIFPIIKPQTILNSSRETQSSDKIPTLNARSTFQPSTVDICSKIERPVPSKENSDAPTSSIPMGNPGSRLAQIKKRLAEKKRREEEF